MISTCRRSVALLAVVSLAAACTSSGSGGLSEEEASERVGAVIDAFADAADEAGFTEDDEDDDEDVDFECEGFESFSDDGDGDSLATDEFEVTDGGEPEVSDVDDDGRVTFEGGEVTGGVEVGVAEGSELDEAIAAIDAVLDDSDRFADCVEGAFAEAFSEQDDLQADDLDLDVEVEEGDTGDQEILITIDGTLELSGDGFTAAFELNGYLRLIRLGPAGIFANVFAAGRDIDHDSIEPAVDAAIEEFEAQFG